MRKLFFTFLFSSLLITGFTQEKKDSTRFKWAIELIAGANTSYWSEDFHPPQKNKIEANEFTGINAIYSFNRTLKISIGISYHHFTSYVDYVDYGRFGSYTSDLKMESFPVHFIVVPYQTKKMMFSLFVGPEPGGITEGTQVYRFNGYSNKSPLRYTGDALYLTGGGNISYSINSKIDILLGASYSKQVVPFNDRYSGYGVATVSFLSMNLGIQYKFIKNKKA